MNLGVALTLAECSSNDLVVENALLLLANTCSSDANVAQDCIKLGESGLLSDKVKVKKHQDTLVRLFSTSLTHLDHVKYGAKLERDLCELFFDALNSKWNDKAVKHFCLLGLGNLCCEGSAPRKIVVTHPFFKDILEREPKCENSLGLLANVSVDHPSPQIASAVFGWAAKDSNAAFALANCAEAKHVKVDKAVVDELLRSPDQSIQESGLDIVTFSGASAIGPTPALCWMTEHINMDVRRKARAQVDRFVDADLLAFIERGCVPVLWHLSLSKEGDDFAEKALNSLRSRLTPTVHQLLRRTLQMEGNEVLRGHVATALAHLGPSVICDDEALDAIITMLGTAEGRQPALGFFQAVHAITVLNYDQAEDHVKDDIGVQTPLPTVLAIMSNHSTDKRIKDQAFSLLLDVFESSYTPQYKSDIDAALRCVCKRVLGKQQD